MAQQHTNTSTEKKSRTCFMVFNRCHVQKLKCSRRPQNVIPFLNEPCVRCEVSSGHRTLVDVTQTYVQTPSFRNHKYLQIMHLYWSFGAVSTPSTSAHINDAVNSKTTRKLICQKSLDIYMFIATKIEVPSHRRHTHLTNR